MDIRNHLLRALPPADWGLVQPFLEPVQLTTGQLLLEQHERASAVIFPETCLISLVQPFSTGQNVVTETVGCEGVVSALFVLVNSRSDQRHLVQIAGNALRLAVADYHRLSMGLASFRTVFSAYAARFLSDALLGVACSRAHSLDQQLARRLLILRDQAATDVLPMTQDMLADMLGVHRPSVSIALGRLEDAGLIRSRRGEITLIDPPGIEAVACECYRIMRVRTPAARPERQVDDRQG